MLGGGGLSNGAIPSSVASVGGGSSTINSGRPKQPPPGFSLLNLTGMHQSSVPPSLLSQGKKVLVTKIGIHSCVGAVVGSSWVQISSSKLCVK